MDRTKEESEHRPQQQFKQQQKKNAYLREYPISVDSPFEEGWYTHIDVCRGGGGG